ncbi:MAG: alpha-glucan family phosphorylase [Chloroflexi bacterium]|nr:alpha-glucan family phosphorylase [Chloroflexota bacterium]
MQSAAQDQSVIAYFSMEVGLHPAMPTYSGGLGVLAGDTLRAAADFGLPMVAVTMLHRKGYFRQHLDSQGRQWDEPAVWSPEDLMTPLLNPLPQRVSVFIEGRRVFIRAWQHAMEGISGKKLVVYYLDTALPENSPWDQTLTDYLYGGDSHYRLCQEAVLGLGGIAVLRALGYHNVHTYHMNEGHSALLTLALLEERANGRPLDTLTPEDLDAVRQRCVFTTHTPLATAHDQFPRGMAAHVIGHERLQALAVTDCCPPDTLDMTYLPMFLSRYVNGVAMRHGETSRAMYPNYPVNSITNGVHATTWTSRPFQELYDRLIPGWRLDNQYLRYAVSIPLEEILQAHTRAKALLLAEVERRSGVRLDPKAMTIGFARRATSYKRHDMLFGSRERLKRIVEQVGPIQVVYGGKAHPLDEGGKAMIRRVFDAAAALKDTMKVVYLEEYDMALAGFLTSGADLWLNTPQKPQEASGTSGMKAALNGVPSFSILDGWWLEGHVEGVTGWAIGDDSGGGSHPEEEIASLYDKLEYVILPTFYGRPTAYAQVMRSAVALNASFFNTHRMLRQYMVNAYHLNGV